MKGKSLLKLLGAIALAAVIAIPFAAGCAAPEPVPGPPGPAGPPGAPGAPAPTPAPAPAPAPAGEVYTCVLFEQIYGGCVPEIWRTKIVDDIERVTNGRLKIDILYPGEHPYKTADLFPALVNGECDMLSFCPVNAVSTDPRFGVEDLPFLQPAGGHEAKKEMHIILQKYFKPIYDEWNVFELGYTFHATQDIFFSDIWLEDFHSLEGKKIRTWTPELDELIKMLGGIPIRIDPAERYTALQTGLVEGLITGMAPMYHQKLVEVANHHQMLDIMRPSRVVLVNKDFWNGLPKDIQDAVLAYWDSFQPQYEDVEYIEVGGLIEKCVVEYGMEVRRVPPDLRAEIVKRAYEEIWVPWADRVGAGGIEALAEVVKALRQAGLKVEGYPS